MYYVGLEFKFRGQKISSREILSSSGKIEKFGLKFYENVKSREGL